MICTFIDWVRGQHALCQTRELNCFLEATVWLDRVIDIMHPVDKCFFTLHEKENFHLCG